jgi:hypothetical protein
MSGTPRKRLAAVPAVPPDGQGHAPASRTSKPAAADDGHGPYSRPPRSPALLPGERQPMLAEVLDGVRLGAYDRHAVDWLCRWVDTPTFLALLGMVHRARQAAADRASKPQREGSQR